ncbi:hypothetical protein ANN_02203 [Periplaneta americana]|uniref:HTH psq-type domain-containing protein n=1 Tax=Periplaneta americana TaxID=6978 RepID=A0ABQ8TWR1_PERAM|nr:hypothetical protein ANN_02203 [Periplaneta americana]
MEFQATDAYSSLERTKVKYRINSDSGVEKNSLLSKNLKVRIYKTVILPVVLYGCETWTLTLREEHRLRVFENKVLRKIFGAKRDEVTGEWRKIHNAELHTLYSSPDIIRNIKSRRLRWEGHVARMGESRNAYRVTNNTLQKHLNTQTTQTNKYNHTGVYKVKCNTCNNFYKGQTGRSFQTRYKEHITAITKLQNTSTYAEHITNANHTYRDINTDMEILHIQSKSQKLNSLEQYEIYRHTKTHPNEILNTQLNFRTHTLFDSTLHYTNTPPQTPNKRRQDQQRPVPKKINNRSKHVNQCERPKIMFTKLEQCSWIKIEVARGRSAQECFQGLRESCGDAALPYRTVTRWAKAFREGLVGSAVKLMFIVAYDIDGVILHHAVPPRQTVNADGKRRFLQHHLRPALRRKRRHLVVQNPIILHDNARSHTAAAVKDLLRRWQWEILEHPPYSPDIAIISEYGTVCIPEKSQNYSDCEDGGHSDNHDGLLAKYCGHSVKEHCATHMKRFVSEERLLQLLIREKRMGYLAASKRFSVPRSTLFDYVRSNSEPTKAVKSKLGRKPILPASLEEKLVDYVLMMERKYFG